jgi:hypothetical protein
MVVMWQLIVHANCVLIVPYGKIIGRHVAQSEGSTWHLGFCQCWLGKKSLLPEGIEHPISTCKISSQPPTDRPGYTLGLNYNRRIIDLNSMWQFVRAKSRSEGDSMRALGTPCDMGLRTRVQHHGLGAWRVIHRPHGHAMTTG